MTETNKFTKRTVAPFRFDVVGSFLRPKELKEARAKFAAGDITETDLKLVEDTAIINLINKEEAAGIKSITDGEFRRSWWHLDFFWGLKGIKKAVVDKGYMFNDEETRAETAKLTGKVSGESHPFVEHFKFLRDHLTDQTSAKQTIPAPAQLIAELKRPENIDTTRKFYATDEELVADIAAAYKQVALDLYDSGLRVLQIDDCTWGMLAGSYIGAKASSDAEKINQEKLLAAKELYVSVNNAFLEDLPEDLIVTTHDCRGNYHSTWASSGGYASVADPLFTREKVSAFFLEYDNDRSGGFEPLAKVGEQQIVVLGLITTKTGKLEAKNDVIHRIYEAAKYVPLDRLALSTQCGFASTEEGNILTEAEQWAKISLVKEIAEEVWDI